MGFDEHRRGALHLGDGGAGERHELAVDDHRLGGAVIEDIADRIILEPCVDRVEDGTTGRNAETRLGLGGNVGNEGRHHIAGLNAGLGESRGKAAHAGMVFGIGRAEAAVDDSLMVRKKLLGTIEVAQRCERHKVGRTFLQPGFILHPTHGVLPKLPCNVALGQALALPPTYLISSKFIGQIKCSLRPTVT